MSNKDKLLISFDFDNTIGMLEWDSKENDFVVGEDGDYIQTPNEKIIAKINNYVKNDYDVIVVTARPEKYKNDVIKKLKIWNVPINKIYCTDNALKVDTLKKLGVYMHYDDDLHELKALRNTSILGILVKP